MENQEEWKPVEGYEGFYEVSDLGRVKSLPRKWAKGGILKPVPKKKGGYLKVGLCKNGKQETCLVHQLVMEAFVGRCPDGYEVDHYDWNPSNNKLENLSYQPKGVNRARHSPEGLQNISEAAKKLHQDQEYLKKIAEATRKACCKPVDQFTLDGTFVKRWSSASEAARELGVYKQNISTCCQGKRHIVGGYIWRYAVCST